MKVYIYHLLNSVLPLVMYRSSVLISNIIAAYLLSKTDFTDLSSAYLISVLISTPAIAITNYKVNLYNLNTRNIFHLVGFCVASCLVFTLFFGWFLFALTPLMIIFSGVVTVVVTCASLSTLIFISNGNYDYVKNSTILASTVYIALGLIIYLNEISNISLISTMFLIYPFGVIIYLGINLISQKLRYTENIQKTEAKAKPNNFIFLAGTILLGSPVHLIALSILKENTNSDIQVGLVNLAFHWFVLVTVIPGMITNVSIRFIRKTDSISYYKLITLGVSIGLSLLFFINIDMVLNLYPNYKRELGGVLKVYLFAAILSVWYQVLINSLFVKGRFKFAFGISLIYGILYIAATFIFTTAKGSGVALGLSMLFAYFISIFSYYIFYHYKRVKHGSI